MNARRAILTALCALFVVVPAMATELGDDAPPLTIKKWLRGTPVDLAEGRGKNVYVIEFWATWCGPCIRGMPHLTDLQKEYKDRGLVIVSVTAADPRQNLESVEKWVKNMDFMLGYTIAFDDGHKTDNAYMGAFKKKGIPQCFVVDKQGKLVWEGHPMFGLDAVIKTILTGDYDIKKLAEVGEKAAEAKQKEFLVQQEMMMAYFELVSKSASLEKAEDLGRKIFKAYADEPSTLNELSWRILTDEGIKARDLKLALRAAETANRAMHGKDPSILDTYALALFKNGDIQGRDKAPEEGARVGWR